MIYKWTEELYQQVSSCLANFSYCVSTDFISSIKHTIRGNNINGLDYIIKNKLYNAENRKILAESSDNLLPLCYFYSKIIFAEKLINAGAVFKGDYITFTEAYPGISTAQQHLKVIESKATQEELIKANTILLAMDSLPINVYKSNDSCTDYVQTWLSITHTDNRSYSSNFSKLYTDLVISPNLVITNLTSFVAFANYPNADVKILSPILNDISSSFHCFGLSFVYVPFIKFNSLERATLIHEIGHYIIYTIFENEGYPFSKGNITQMQEYDEAATKTLCKVGEIIEFKCENKITKGLKSHEVAFNLLKQGIITIFHYQNLLKSNETTIEQKNKIFNITQNKFNISSAFIEKYGNEKVIDILAEGVIKEFNLSQSSKILLERIGEYVNRGNKDDYSSELIVRLPELIARGLNNNTLSYLEPLQNFWLANIGNLDVDRVIECNKEYIVIQSNSTAVEIIGDSTEEEL